MLKWIHKLFNPHCPHCELLAQQELDEIREDKICKTCEVLKEQLRITTEERDKLLSKIIDPKVETPQVVTPLAMTQSNKSIPWSVRRTMLENEDRHKASLLEKKVVAPTDVVVGEKISLTTEELERELSIPDVEVKNA